MAVALAGALAEADSDDLAVGVALMTRPHADALSEAKTMRGRLARLEVTRMPSGFALNLGIPCEIAQSGPSVSPGAKGRETATHATPRMRPVAGC